MESPRNSSCSLSSIVRLFSFACELWVSACVSRFAFLKVYSSLDSRSCIELIIIKVGNSGDSEQFLNCKKLLTVPEFPTFILLLSDLGAGSLDVIFHSGFRLVLLHVKLFQNIARSGFGNTFQKNGFSQGFHRQVVLLILNVCN